MPKQQNQNRYKPKAVQNPLTKKRWLLYTLFILIILFIIELLKPVFHASPPEPSALKSTSTTAQNDMPTFDFYQVLPKVSLASANLTQLDTTTQPISPTTAQAPKDSDVTYALQMGSFKDVDQATALASKINTVRGLGTYRAFVAMAHQGQNTWYIVKIGPFPTSQAAEDIQDTLDRYYYSGRIFTNQK
jgi:cell division protein FtsN